MGTVLYTARDKRGREKRGFIEALNNKDALEHLSASGLNQIELHWDAAFASNRDDLEGISEKELAQIAKFELELHKGVSASSFMKEVLRNNLIPMGIGGAMVLYGISDSSAWWVAFGVILSLALPFFSLWNYNLLQTHSAMYKALSFGEWESIKTLAPQLKERAKNPDVSVEADTLLAAYYAHHKDMPTAIQILGEHESYLGDKAGSYENKLGTLYFHAKEYEQSLFYLKQAYVVSKENMMLADWALAEARFGDIEKAKENLSQLDLAQLPPYGIPFIDYIKGIIAYKEGDLIRAKNDLLRGITGFSAYDKNPAVWAALAMVNVMLAIVLEEMGERENAYEYLSEGVVKIAQEHAETPLLECLKEKFPTRF
jgi:hypothetical protein